MKIGVPKEVKPGEGRISVTPAGAAEFVKRGNEVFVQATAGEKSSYSDADYIDAGAKILQTPEEVWAVADMIIKVKEPIECEYQLIKKDQIIYTYLHLAGVDPNLTHVLLEKNATAIAYETVQEENGTFPLLAPMSRVAGCASITEGGHHLKKQAGIFLGSIPGVKKTKCHGHRWWRSWR
jgi:alanine dehydrogenase